MDESSLPFRPRPERIGWLVYEPGDRPNPRYHAQARFLEAALKVQPQILPDLADEPARIYKEVRPFWFNVHREFLWLQEEITWQAFIDELETSIRNGWNADLGSLKVSLEQWAARWHLDKLDWVKAAGLRTLIKWGWDTEPPTPLAWEHGEMAIFEPLSRAERRFQLSLDGFDPTLETSDEAKLRIREAFEQRLTAHLKEVNSRIAEAGFVLTSTTHGGDDQWTWLAQRVVLEWTYANIAKEAGIQRRAFIATASVHEAVTKAAALAGLPLPKGKPGRRPKVLSARQR